MHVIEESRGLEVESSRLKEAVPTEFRRNSSWLAWPAKGPFSEFLLSVRDRFIEAGRTGAGSTQSVSRDSIEEGGGVDDLGCTLRVCGEVRG